jgi:hypothetical protein
MSDVCSLLERAHGLVSSLKEEVCRIGVICVAVLIVLVTQTGCAVVADEKTIQSQAYDLYGKSALAFQKAGYEERKEFYPEAYAEMDLMELRARVATDAAYDQQSQFNGLQDGFITPIQELRTTLKKIEGIDKRGGLAKAGNKEDQVGSLNQQFYNVIHRQTSGR